MALKVLDAARTVVFQKEGNPAPDLKAQIALESGSPESLLRRDAMTAVISVRGQETPTFKTLAKFIRDDVDRPAALRNIQRIPRDYWIADEAKPLVETLTAWVGTLNVSGYHWHFLSDDKALGGHVLNCEFDDGVLQFDECTSLVIKLPQTKQFDRFDVRSIDDRDINVIERQRNDKQ